jgi:pimeloyl-ACP methyl ester carboxylesterase
VPITKPAQRSGLIAVNGADLYHEVRGSGPAVLLIQGTTGDGFWFEALAQRLATDFTVVLYDRRGNSRSPRPDGWTETSIAEQADDAAGLIQALGLAPAVVFGTSDGGTILLDLLARRPEVVRGALIHEPSIGAALSHPEALTASFETMIAEGMTRGGPRGAMESLLRHYATEDVFDALSPEERDRAVGSAEVFMTMEMERFASYAPDLEAVRASGAPVAILKGRESDRYADIPEEVSWLSEKLAVPVTEVPGAHVGYMQHPDDWADILRRIIREMSEEE